MVKQCFSCKKLVEYGRFYNENGTTRYLCDGCIDAATAVVMDTFNNRVE